MTQQRELDQYEVVLGCLLGTAIGDALGLPYEGLKPQRASRMLGMPTRYRFFLGYGMVSDDTEHTCLVLQSLIESGDDPELFARCLAKRFRKWILLFPAGVGRATARACLKLLFGFSPENSGVYSAGNGPAMRSAILGATIDDLKQLVEFVRVSSRLTHTDPKAEHGALAIALAAWLARRESTIQPDQYFPLLIEQLSTHSADEFLYEIEEINQSLKSGETTIDYAARRFLGKGVSGYTLHTVPVVLHAWLSGPQDFHEAISMIIRCGGDADTTAAILGGILGTKYGCSHLPDDLIAGLIEWPRSVTWMRRLAKTFVRADSPAPDRSSLFILPRNILFLGIVLFHGFRRIAPPY